MIKKGFFKFKTFWQAYKEHQTKSMLIHFRWATHGERVAENCHPFMLAKDAALIHNGILSGFTPPAQSTLSDTRLFCEGYLVPGMHLVQLDSHSYFSSPALRGFVESLIGTSNKLAVMTTKGIIIFNEAQGEWNNGAWYSAGYPEDYYNDARNKYFQRLYGKHDTGLQGEDTWLDDMMCEEPKNKPLTGNLSWDDIDDTDEFDDEENEPCEVIPSIRHQESCMFCSQDSDRMYKIDGQWVCGGCWGHYTEV
mgnify:CR=1 FL=1